MTNPLPPFFFPLDGQAMTDTAFRFFASSWDKASSCSIKPTGHARISAECKSRLAHIAGTLPPRFQSSVADAQRCMDNLFDPGYPLVSTHGDLSENNLFVNKETGELTGVIGLAELSFLPFGLDFYGLEEIVGYLGLEGWGEHDGAQELRAHFWVIFANSAKLDAKGPEMRTIREARLVGILFRYGTRADAGFSGMLGQFKSQDPSSVAMLMLDGLVLRR